MGRRPRRGQHHPSRTSAPPLAPAKTTVTGLLGDLGRRPAWIEDLGDITTARATGAMILVVPHVLRRHGFEPFAVSPAR
ncbi:hypothetical protein [Streptomyces sp. AGS-58]|uniref:hypothetical protein n=1 Tax=unclassified Streptomyces TaxID=2593676 RepID=UPI0035A269B7